MAAELLPVSLQQLVTDRLLGLCHLETILNPPNLIAITGWSADPSESLIGLAEELCAQVLRALGTTVTVGVGRACRNFMELSGSRRDSLAAVEYKAIAGEGRAYYYGDLQSVEWEPFDLSLIHILVGTGFAVSQALMDRLGGWNTETMAEDAEFAAQCAMAGVRAVSYTHLDVYKRQPLSRGGGEIWRSFWLFWIRLPRGDSSRRKQGACQRQ